MLNTYREITFSFNPLFVNQKKKKKMTKEISILYSLIASNDNVLCEYIAKKGNYKQLASALIENVSQKKGSKRSFQNEK